MKRFYITILITICGLTAMAQDRPDITHQTGGGDRIKFGIVYDKPTLTIDNEAQEIIVEGSDSEYYIVSITHASTQAVILESVIDGVYDIIDMSMLTSGSYIISLTSSQWNTYSWTYENGQISNYGSASVNGLRFRSIGGTSIRMFDFDY